MTISAGDVLKGKKVSLVLGGGALKGFAHVGVLQALEEEGVVPQRITGTSIGSLIGAAMASGVSVEEMRTKALSFKKSRLFQFNRREIIMRRLSAPSVYKERGLWEVCASVVADKTFEELGADLLVNTVDLALATTAVWGLPGMKHASVLDAVYASCALPGFFPPGEVGGRMCADGGIIDNLPVGVGSRGMDFIIAVDTGSSQITSINNLMTLGFGGIYMRAAGTMMHALQLGPLEHWNGIPMLLIRPKVSHLQWFTTKHTADIIEAGYSAAKEALAAAAQAVAAGGGIYPRRLTRVSVDREKCIGCTLCTTISGGYMVMKGDKAVPSRPVVRWSGADGDFVRHCPTGAINAEHTEGDETANEDATTESGNTAGWNAWAD